jgi:predicted nucleic acid-binding protein
VRWFFDSSVLVPAFLPDHVHHARSFAAFASASPKNAACAAHSLAEVYATFTRYPGKQRLSAEAAALLVQEIERRLTLVWLDGDEYRAVIRRMATMGIVGGAVYDGLVAACALKAHATYLYTWNLRHFSLLGAEIQKLATMPPTV